MYLKTYSTVVRKPTNILNRLLDWQVVSLAMAQQGPDLRRWSQALASDFLPVQNPPASSVKKGYAMKDCKEDACKNCRVAGHGTKDFSKAPACNLCDLTDHVYKACLKRERTWASVVAKPHPTCNPLRLKLHQLSRKTCKKEEW